tara:strand:- start:86 stop:766 length:681 start_codon:yes stop_codon:yes gene_type:complete
MKEQGRVGESWWSGEFVDENPLMEFEADYWGNCCNTLDEESKQFLYAKCMGLQQSTAYGFMVNGKKILDIGGGPVSLLLKCYDHGGSKVVDPLKYPRWTVDRYNSHNVEYDQKSGEDVHETGYDEVWIYNCLQHVIDPQKIIENAKKAAPVLRIWEWIDIPAHDGHPHELKEDLLNKWIGNVGSTGYVGYTESSPYGLEDMILNDRSVNPLAARCYYGTFHHNKIK